MPHDGGDGRRPAVDLWVGSQEAIGAWGYGQQVDPDSCFVVEGGRGHDHDGGGGRKPSSESIAAMADDDVYTWGCGEFGRLGHNDEDDKLVQTKLKREHFRGSRVVMVEAGKVHSVAVTVEGELFVWGYGGYCQLGLGDRHKRLTLTLVRKETFDWSRLLMVACDLSVPHSRRDGGGRPLVVRPWSISLVLCSRAQQLHQEAHPAYTRGPTAL